MPIAGNWTVRAATIAARTVVARAGTRERGINGGVFTRELKRTCGANYSGADCSIGVMYERGGWVGDTLSRWFWELTARKSQTTELDPTS